MPAGNTQGHPWNRLVARHPWATAPQPPVQKGGGKPRSAENPLSCYSVSPQQRHLPCAADTVDVLQVCAALGLMSSRELSPRPKSPLALSTPILLTVPPLHWWLLPSIHLASCRTPACSNQDPLTTLQPRGTVTPQQVPAIHEVDHLLPLHTHLFSQGGLSSHHGAGRDPGQGLTLTSGPNTLSAEWVEGSGQLCAHSLLSPFCPPPSHLHLQANNEQQPPSSSNSARRVPLPRVSSKAGLATMHPCGSHSGELDRGKTSLEAGEDRGGCRAQRIGPF